jgi:branched-chain amino acid transport system substrate-binding protein
LIVAREQRSFSASRKTPIRSGEATQLLQKFNHNHAGRIDMMTGGKGTTRRRFMAGALAATSMPYIMKRQAFAQNGPFVIGQLADMSGIVVDLSGPGTTTAMKMAIEDFGGEVLGRKIQLITGDHTNKPDIGIGMARKWYDQGVNAIFDIGITTVAVGVQDLAKEKNKPVIFLSSSSTDLTGKFCSPNGIHWIYDSYSQANGAVHATQADGPKSWYFLTVDYAFGHNSQRDATKMIEAGGGKVIGSTPHPFETTDYSSDLLKAQSSGADVIGLATTTAHIANILKQAEDFGVRQNQKIAPLSLTIHDVKAVGLPIAQGINSSGPFYWDQDDESRAFSKRYFAAFGRMPNEVQASAWGAVTHYLNAVKAVGSTDTAAIMAKMKETPINDFMTKNGVIRADGRVLRPLRMLRVKSPEKSTGEWDIYEVTGEIPQDKAFAPPNPEACALVR